MLFDLDGTIYLSGKPYPGVPELFASLQQRGIEYGFATNNSSVAPEAYVHRLRDIGIPVERRNVLSSAEAVCLALEELELGPEIFVLGTGALKGYLAEQGYVHTTDKPGAVLVAFDTELTYEKLTTATRLVLDGVPLIATHPDPICPGPLPDAGMLTAAITAGTNVKPCAIAGKPYRWMARLALERFGVAPERTVMVGDRLDPDIRFARQFGMQSILVLNGAPKPPRDSEWKPDMVIERIGKLADVLLAKNAA